MAAYGAACLAFGVDRRGIGCCDAVAARRASAGGSLRRTPVYLLLVLVSGAIARDDWDLLYRLVLAIPGGTIISRYWKRELA